MTKASLNIKVAVKAGGIGGNNHNRTLKVRTAVKAGGIGGNNHNRALSV